MQAPVCGATLPQVEDVLRSSVSGLQEQDSSPAARGPGRPCELSAHCVWAALLVCLLRGLHRQKAVWRRLRLGPLGSFAHSVVTASALYKRLAQAGPAPLEPLFAQISGGLIPLVGGWVEQGEREGTLPRLAPFAPDLLVLDETILDQVARRWPILRAVAKGAAVLIPGNRVSLFRVRTQPWRRIHVEAESLQHEQVSARLRLTDLARGTLVLFDLGYDCVTWFDDLTDLGFWSVSRIRHTSPMRVLHGF